MGNDQIEGIENYSFKVRNKHVRLATLIRFKNGSEIRFMDRLSKKEAVIQAGKVLAYEARQGIERN